MKSLELVINSVSFGQISVGLLRELYLSGHNPIPLFVIQNNLDFSSYDEDQGFLNWVQTCISCAQKDHDRNNIGFKLWHLNGSLSSPTKEQCLLTFYETDSPTETELNILKNQKHVFVTSEYTKQVFETYGAENISYLPLFFDKFYFKKLDKQFFSDERIVFNIVGKLEKRKNHQQVIQSWVKKYGNDPRYYLNCAIFNPFLKPEENADLWRHILNGQNYFNVKFHPFMSKNTMYNDFLNSGDIVLGMSGGENWDLPAFHSVGIGKHAVILDCNGYKGWANKENSVLIKPNGRQNSHDGHFFVNGAPFNQGNFFTFNEDEFINGCEDAINKVRESKVNQAGLKIQENFTAAKTISIIEEKLIV